MFALKRGRHSAPCLRSEDGRKARRIPASSRRRSTPFARIFSIICVCSSLHLSQAHSQQTPAPGVQQTSAFDRQNQQLEGRSDSADDREPFFNVNFPEQLSPLLPDGTARDWLHKNRLRLYGWLEGGYTYASTGNGLLTDAPTPNRFGNEFLLNGAWLIVDKVPLNEGWSWGFRADFYAGSDAALLRPLGSFGPTSTHMGTDFRQAYFSLHTPGINSHGIDWTLGRQNVPTGYETLMAPYRPLYSESYFWIKYEVGSTSALATIHPTAKLDLIGGVVMGYNTVFELRGRSPSYVTRALYRPHFDKYTQLIATVYTGPEPVAVTAGHLGTWQTVAELQARHVWTPRIAQVAQVHYATDVHDPTTKRVSATQGAYLVTAFKIDPKLYLRARGEWFSDPHGVRNETPGTYSEATAGINYMPISWLNFRPEIRGDFAGQRSFAASLGGPARRNQLTVAFDLIVKFDAFR
jgi:Putative beta-barrel porin-2, OmpL-like. bbp2